MKKPHRILCLLLVLCFVSVALLAACEEAEESSGSSSVQSSGSTTSESQFPLEKKDFGGVKITFLTNENSDYYKWEIAPQEMVEGDRINNACNNRKELIKQEFGIELVQEYVKTQDDVINTLRDSIESGLDDYQVGVSGLLYLAKLTDAELFLDLAHIESNNYIDLSKPYWDQSIMRDLTLLDSVYFATGDALITDDESTWAIFFNKDIAEDHNIAANYGVDSLYDLVRNGEWNIDTFHEIVASSSVDNNDFGMAWGADTPDVWGMISQCYDSYAFTVGCGQTLMHNDGTEITVTAGEQSNLNAFDKVFNLLTESDSVAIAETTGKGSDTYYADMTSMFAAGKGLFMPNRIATVSDPILRDADIHYGLLPMPKLDETQDEYTTTVTVYWCSAFAIPVTNVEKLDATCYALEALAYYGMEQLTPEYYDHTLKDKRFEDDESVEMLDLIFRNRTYDMGAVYNFGGSLPFYTGILLSGLSGGSNTHASTLESVQSTWETAIQSFIKKVISSREDL